MASTYETAAPAVDTKRDFSVPVVAAENLHKSFGDQTVLNGINLGVRPRRNPGRARAKWHGEKRSAETHHWP